MSIQILKEILALPGVAVHVIDRFAIWGAKSVKRLIGVLALLGVALVALMAFSTDYLLVTSGEHYQLRKGSENANSQDEQFLVAQEAVKACDDADKAKRDTAKEACIEAETRYKHAMTMAGMSADRLQERLRTATYSNWLIDVNKTLRLQREKRGSRERLTLVETIHSWTSTDWGYAALTIVLIVLPFARVAWVVNKEQEKEKKKLAGKTVPYHHPIRRSALAGIRQRTRLRNNRPRQTISL